MGDRTAIDYTGGVKDSIIGNAGSTVSGRGTEETLIRTSLTGVIGEIELIRTGGAIASRERAGET